MPPLAPVPNVAKCQLLWRDSSDNDVSTNLYFRYSGNLSSAVDAANLATALVNAFSPLVGSWDASTVLTGAKVTDLSSPSGGAGAATSNIPGTASGGVLPGGTCLVANYAIARRYRGGKPRSYFPWGTATDLQTRQQWTTTFLSATEGSLLTAFSTFIGTTEGAATITAHVNVSYYSGFTVEGGTGGKRAKNVSTPRPTPLVDDIHGVTLLSRPGSQRKRNA